MIFQQTVLNIEREDIKPNSVMYEVNIAYT